MGADRVTGARPKSRSTAAEGCWTAMPYPENLDHHFVVDPTKFDFYAMDCYRILGEDKLAGNLAEEVIQASYRLRRNRTSTHASRRSQNHASCRGGKPRRPRPSHRSWRAGASWRASVSAVASYRGARAYPGNKEPLSVRTWNSFVPRTVPASWPSLIPTCQV